jgi:hypothetical protein
MAAINFPSSPTNGQIYTENGVTYQYDSTATVWKKIVPTMTGCISFGIDGGGSAITTGQKGTIEVPYDFDIIRWTLLADQSGSANIDMWSRDYSTTLPTPANSVTGNLGMTLSTASSNQSSAISNWRMTRINAGNVISFNVQSASTITRAIINLYGKRGL